MDFYDILPFIIGSITAWYYFAVYKRPSKNKELATPLSDPSTPLVKTITMDGPRAHAHKPERGTIDIPSWSDSSKLYHVDLDTISCTCPDFTDRRSSNPTINPTRCCKHLVAAFDQIGAPPTELAACWHMIDFIRNHGNEYYKKGSKRIVDSVEGKPLALYLHDWQKCEYDKAWIDFFYAGWRHGYNPISGNWTHSARELPEFPEVARWVLNFIEGIPSPLTATQIVTTQRNGKEISAETPTGLNITATVNAKAKWMTFQVRNWRGRFNVQTGEVEADPELFNIENAICNWLSEEYKASRTP